MTCETCIGMKKKKGDIPDCTQCKQGFVEPDPENYTTIGIIEKYGVNTFIDGMGSINTNSIKNVLEAENISNQEYQNEFHNLILFVTTALQSNRDKKEETLNGNRR